MQLNYTGHVVRSEWRWLFLVSVILLLMTVLPILIVALRSLDNTTQWHFMGVIHGASDGAVWLSQMLQGTNGNWLVDFQHTPEIHRSILVNPLYALLGQLSSPSTSFIIIMFHLARLTAAFVMYTTIYHLGATIWVKIRSRRIFFIIASLGSGLGWLTLIFTGQLNAFDFTVAQAFPFYSTILNVHYPLTITLLALLASVVIAVLRPGNQEEPAVNNIGVIAFIISLTLAFIYPETLLPLSIAVILSVLAHWYNRQFSQREVRWLLWILVPALPILTYYLITMMFNPLLAGWVQQRATLYTFSLSDILLGVTPPIIIALPGIGRALRRFEADGDRFMILWLIAMLLMSILPLPMSASALAGLMLPVAYFATRSAEDQWLPRIPRRRRSYVYVLSAVILLITPALTLILPILPIAQHNRPVYATLAPNYIPALEWLSTRVDANDVVIASPRVSPWVPFWTGARTYYGHPAQTMQAPERFNDVIAWYRAPDKDSCHDLLYWNPAINRLYPVRYVLLGEHERALGQSVCFDMLTLVATFDDVAIYANLPDLP